jgi:hypothetical protein
LRRCLNINNVYMHGNISYHLTYMYNFLMCQFKGTDKFEKRKNWNIPIIMGTY